MEVAPSPSPGQADFANLATQIREAHAAVGHAAGSLLVHAMRAGDALLAAKSRPEIPHGEWQRWLKKNCDLSERTARVYMRLAQARSVLDANRQHAAGLTLRGALRLIAKRAGGAAPGQGTNSQNTATALNSLHAKIANALRLALGIVKTEPLARANEAVAALAAINRMLAAAGLDLHTIEIGTKAAAKATRRAA